MVKKIINGKMYNTETAKEQGSYENMWNNTDFNHYSETLYKKKTKEFFLYGSGGALSKYSSSGGGSSWGTNEIIPLTDSEAKNWAMEHLEADEYIDIFGEVEE
jgi:hypothetical protein